MTMTIAQIQQSTQQRAAYHQRMADHTSGMRQAARQLLAHAWSTLMSSAEDTQVSLTPEQATQLIFRLTRAGEPNTPNTCALAKMLLDLELQDAVQDELENPTDDGGPHFFRRYYDCTQGEQDHLRYKALGLLGKELGLAPFTWVDDEIPPEED